MALLLHSHNLFSHMGEPNVQIQSARRYLVLHITYPGTTNSLDQFALELTAPAHHASSLYYIRNGSDWLGLHAAKFFYDEVSFLLAIDLDGHGCVFYKHGGRGTTKKKGRTLSPIAQLRRGMSLVHEASAKRRDSYSGSNGPRWPSTNSFIHSSI